MSEIEQVLDLLDASSVPNIWKRDNPAEAETVQSYRDGETTGEPKVRTKFGQALVILIGMERKWAEDEERLSSEEGGGGGLIGGH